MLRRSRSASSRSGAASSRRRNRRSSARCPNARLLEPITRATRRDAIAYLSRRPFENVFLQWVLEGGHGPYAPDELVLSRDRRGTVDGVIYYGSQLVVAADGEPALDAFAIETRKHPHLRSFVGPKERIDALWERVQRWYRAPSVVRERQPLYVARPADLRAGEDVAVRRALASDAELVVDHSARMILGELGYDPRAGRTGYAAGVRRAIALGAWWVWIEDGALLFECNVGAKTAATAQVQGVWSPPEVRGRGVARAALGAVARRLLGEHPTLSLYVNDFNAPAIRLYEALGFHVEGAFATYLFP